MKNAIAFIFLSFIISVASFAQMPGYSQFNTNNGLPSNTVYDVIQDIDGFIWIATDYGISKFDGLKFVNYTIDDGLPDNEILLFFKDSKNRIWLIGFNGRVGYIKNGSFNNSDNQPFLRELTFKNFVSDVYEDSNHNIWFYESGSNIKKLDTLKNISTFSLKIPSNKGVSKKIEILENINNEVVLIVSLHSEDFNNIIQSTIQKQNWKNINLESFDSLAINGLRSEKSSVLIDIDKFSKKIYNAIFISHGYEESNNLLYKLLIFKSNILVTNLVEGALIIESKENNFITKKILPSIHTTKSFIDNENNFWIGSSSNGLYFFPNLDLNGIQFENKNKNNLHSIQFYNNKIIFGNEQSEIILLNPDNLQTTTTRITNSNLERIRKLKIYNDMLYILSDYNIYSLNSNFELENIEYLYGPKFIKKNLTVFKSFTKVYDYIYSANANGVAKINTETRSVEKIWDTRSTAITNSGKDSLWIGTTKGLFLRVNDNIIKFHLNKYFDSSIIYSLQQSPYGLLIGSNSHGFGILKNGNFNNVNTQNGLLSNYIKSIHLDSKNNIWLSTNLGLNCIQISNDGTIKKIISYTTSDGLYSNDVRGCYVDNEKVYIATSNGLNIIDLSKETNQNIAPRVHINTILVNNELVPKNKNHEFDNRLNNIQFNYSGISFKSSGNITFKYRLVGIEDDWIETTNNAIRYSSLPPKSYTFQLKAISKDGIESEQITTFSFKIRPPIYELWWFILLGAFFTLGLTALFLYRRILVIRQRREIKEKISALRYQALNAQMNPHFINNLMIRIENLTDRKEYSKVKDAVHNFAKLVNTILRATKNNLIPMSEEISMVELYIRLQNSRFENEIIFKTNTNSLSQEDLENILVPPMILQPIIENSLKHGFMNSEKQNRISINLKNENDDYLICEIIDNGIGIQNNNNNKISSSGISIKNINERLQLINHSKKEEEMIFISNITNEFNTLVGTKVTLKIPLISI